MGLAIAIAIPWLAVDDPEGLGFRLRLASYVPLALAAAIASRLLIHRLPRLDADALLLAISLAIVLRTPTRRGLPGEVVVHPAMVAAVAAQQIPPNTTAIVPERQVAFMVAWYTRAPVSLHPLPNVPTVRLIALHWMGDLGSPLDAALELLRHTPDANLDPPRGTHPGYQNGFVQVTERSWTWLLDHLPPADRAYFATWPTI